MLYGTLAEYCTDTSCPSMTAGPKYKYLWTDGRSKPADLSAKVYCASLMEWIQSQLEDEKVFPSKVGSFPFYFLFSPNTRC
jgi:MOB kinase activator 1